MKKGLLLSLSVAFSFGVIAQSATRLPSGFRKAEVPASVKNKTLKVPYRDAKMDSGIPFNKAINTRLATPQPNSINTALVDEYLVGLSFYDLQTNASISNRVVKNDDGSFAVSWTYSPVYDAAEAFPQRGTGYNYSADGTTWLFPYVPGSSQGPATRTEAVRTGFTNIVNTTSGAEMSIAHTGTSMSLTRRAAKGTGAWTTSYPWGTGNNDTWPKAVAGGNDLVYAIFQGSGTTGTPISGQDGPMFFSKSTDGGVTWSPKSVIPGTDSTEYLGFGGDDYAIDAKGDVVAIVLGSQLTDLMLLKSTDAGATWTKSIIYKNPCPMLDLDGTTPSDSDLDGIVDTLDGHAGDAALIIDNNNTVHVTFSDFRWYFDATTAGSYNYFPSTDGLEYWNDQMGQNGYYLIAAAEDLNGNGELDVPLDETCEAVGLRWGNYRGGITGMPSMSVDNNNNIYVSYQTIDELADTAQYHQSHRHVYIISTSDMGQTWTYPYDIVPTIAEGGDGENQEAVFAALTKQTDNMLYVLYQRDGAPGHALAAAGTCDDDFNSGNSSDIVFARVDVANMVGISKTPKNELFMTQSYPNPTTGMAYFNVETKSAEDMTITVTDMLGKVVYSEVKSSVPSGVTTVSLNTGNWSSGLYNYTVISGSQKASRQIVVQ